MLSRSQYHYMSYKGIFEHKYLKYKYTSFIPINKITLSAGLYKPSSFFMQYSLMLTNLIGKPAAISYQLHGKRKRQTIATYAIARNSEV